MSFAKTLSREEMKILKAGSGNCGNIHCISGGEQYYCASGSCDDDNANQLINELCLSGCMDMGDCGGCGQFPA